MPILLLTRTLPLMYVFDDEFKQTTTRRKIQESKKYFSQNSATKRSNMWLQ
jgi:hypothetical protein